MSAPRRGGTAVTRVRRVVGSAASIRSRCGSRPGGSFSAVPSGSTRLVDGEAGHVGRDLEQHAAGLAEVDRAEVVAVPLLGDRDAVRRRPAARPSPPARHRRPPGRRRGGPSPRPAGPAGSSPTARSVTWPPSAGAGRERIERTLPAGLGEAEHVGQDRRGRRGLREEQRDAVEAADRVLGRARRLPAQAGSAPAPRRRPAPASCRPDRGRAGPSRRRPAPAPRGDSPSRRSGASTSRSSRAGPRTPSPASRRSRAGPAPHAPRGRRSGWCRGCRPRRRNRGGRCRDRRS